MARRLFGLILLLSCFTATPALPAAPRAELSHDVFVAARNTSHVSVLDPDTFELAATLDVGLVPSALAISVPLKLLVVADGVSPRIGFVDLSNCETRMLPLDFVPRRILFAPGGTILVAIDDAGGNLAFIDATERSVTARVADRGAIREALFSDDGRTLYLSDQIGLTAITAADGATTKRLVAHTPFSTFARSPNGREGFGVHDTDGMIDIFDVRRGQRLDSVRDQRSADAVFVTGTGRFLVLLDTTHQQVTIATVDPLRNIATIPGRANMGWAYSAWFDTVAFVTSTTGHELLVYDLDHTQQSGSIELDGVPGPGAVTPDGSKLFLPIADRRAVLVIDATTARVVGRVPLPAAPTLVVMEGSYGLCH